MRKILEKPYRGELLTLEDLRTIKEFIENLAYAFQREISKEDIEEALRRDIEIKSEKLKVRRFNKLRVEEAVKRIEPGNLETYIDVEASLLSYLKIDELWDKWKKDPEYREEDLWKESRKVIAEVSSLRRGKKEMTKTSRTLKYEEEKSDRTYLTETSGRY